MTNYDLSLKVFELLEKCAVETVIICAGARNAALVIHLENYDFKKIYYFEERSAAFFALGLMKSSGKPVAIITTSGTAAAELLPATIEAFYQSLPLILITADRPKSYRLSGAPQSIQQIGLYSHYVEQTLDWDIETKSFHIATCLASPLHLNVCFDEPLIDEPLKFNSESLLEVNVLRTPQTFFPEAALEDYQLITEPLIVVGQIDDANLLEVIDFLKKMNAPIYLESLSQLCGEKSLQDLTIYPNDYLVKKIFQKEWCKSIVRIGAIPTLRFWRDLEYEFKNIPVFNFSNQKFSGLSRKTANFNMSFKNSGAIPKNLSKNLNKNVLELSSYLQLKKMDLLKGFPLCEPAFVFYFSKKLTAENLYLGNSLPIREWDQFADPQSLVKNIYANRGANGIDGQISTYLGWSSNRPSSCCLIGDLTALYDLAALGLVQNSDSARQIVVINNKGGQIFKRTLKKDQFLNTHNIDFKDWAKMWKWEYLRLENPEDFTKMTAVSKVSKNTVIELVPNASQTENFWKAWDNLCTTI